VLLISQPVKAENIYKAYFFTSVLSSVVIISLGSHVVLRIGNHLLSSIGLVQE